MNAARKSLFVILEDNADRRRAMQTNLTRAYPSIRLIFFESAHEMVAWLTDHQSEASFISLDHDLPLLRNSNNELIDFGDGMIVVQFLKSRPPTCPIIVHTSNSEAGSKMLQSLADSGWPALRIFPENDLNWIPAA